MSSHHLQFQYFLFFRIFNPSDSEQFGFHYSQYICPFDQSILYNQRLTSLPLPSPTCIGFDTPQRCPPQGHLSHSLLLSDATR